MSGFHVVAVVTVDELARLFRARAALGAGFYDEFDDYESWRIGTRRMCHRIAVEDAGVPNHGPREVEA